MSNELTTIGRDEALSLIPQDPTAMLERAETLISYMAGKCSGPKFVSTINGRLYPKVEWWTTVGAGLQLFPREASSIRAWRMHSSNWRFISYV